MVVAVTIGEGLSLGAEVLLQQRVHDDLFANRVARNLPDQLARPALLRVLVACGAEILVIVLVDLRRSVNIGPPMDRRPRSCAPRDGPLRSW